MKSIIEIFYNDFTRFENFEGDLNTPLERFPDLSTLPAGGLYGGYDRIQQAYGALQLEIAHKKLNLLMKHYEIGPDSNYPFMDLSLCLARHFIPGFQPAELDKETRGAKKKWTFHLVLELRSDVNKLVSESSDKLSIKKACEELAKNEKWKSILRQNKEADDRESDPGEALRSAYKMYDEYVRRSKLSRIQLLEEIEKWANEIWPK